MNEQTVTRDVRLGYDDLTFLLEATTRRRHELEKRLERTSYAGKPNMKDAVVTELAKAREMEETLKHNRDAVMRVKADRVRATLTEPQKAANAKSVGLGW